MDTAQLFFRVRNRNNADEILDKIQGYLAALLHNGQVVGGHASMAKVKGGFWVTASLPQADALDDRFANKWVRKRLRELGAVGVERPKVKHLGADPESRRPCKCRKRPFLILFTTFMNREPPLRCGACFGQVALYKVPSELSADGRELARGLEKALHVPVYYYLYKHYGRSDKAERKRVCPSCGRAWLRKEPLHRIFDFQCRRCRLLSNVAFDVRLAL